MEWTDIRLTVAKADAENAEAVATLIAEGGIYIEDYSDIEQQVAEIAHVDLIEQELLDKPRDTVIIHLYLEPGASQVETLALIAARMEAAGIPYTVETEGVEQEDWQNGWRKYYHPMEIGQRLAVVPGALIFYESPHRIVATLEAVAEVFPQREVAVCRELTKLHEEVLRLPADELAANLVTRDAIKGEIALVIAPPDVRAQQAASFDDPALRERIAAELAAGTPKSALAKQLARELGLPKNKLYDLILEM